VTALLINENYTALTHNGVKTKFSEHFIKSKVFPTEIGRIYSQLFSWRQKGDYSDLYDFTEERVLPYFQPVKDLIHLIEEYVNQ
jgi:uncharacterized protein (UPF0332 family)